MKKLSKNTKRQLAIGAMLPANTPATVVGYKEPLRKIEKGFGYYGTIAYDVGEEFTQCHICGYFFKFLGGHLSAEHSLSSKEYKTKFGISLGSSLLAPHTRQRWIQKWKDQTKTNREEVIARLIEGQSREGRRVGSKSSLERKNRQGNCPDQLIQKIVDLSSVLEHTPSSNEFIAEYGRGFEASARRTFGSWNNAIKLAGLQPNPSGGQVRYRYTETQAIAMLRDFKERFGREPYYSDIKEGVLPSWKTYKRIFGGWSKAKEIAYK